MTTRIFFALTAVIGWIALVIQFPITIANSRAVGMSTIGGIVTFFSFFTILTNLLVVTGSTFLLWPKTRMGQFFSRPIVTSALASYIAMVGIGYSVLLRHVWNPEGLQKFADILLHDAVPLLYVAGWLLFVPKGRLRWHSVVVWLLYPLAYLGFVLVRGALTDRYPYPFVDVGQLGYSSVIVNATMLVVAFVVVSGVVLELNRRMARKAPIQRDRSI